MAPAPAAPNPDDRRLASRGADKNGGDVAFYIDGALVHSGTGAANSAAGTPWHLMRNRTYDPRWRRCFDPLLPRWIGSERA